MSDENDFRKRLAYSRPKSDGGASVYRYANRLKRAMTPVAPVRYLCIKCKKVERPKDSPDRLCEGCRCG